MKIGFIGLGIMGKHMAKDLLKAVYEVRVNNCSKGPMEEPALLWPNDRFRPVDPAMAAQQRLRRLRPQRHRQIL